MGAQKGQIRKQVETIIDQFAAQEQQRDNAWNQRQSDNAANQIQEQQREEALRLKMNESKQKLQAQFDAQIH